MIRFKHLVLLVALVALIVAPLGVEAQNWNSKPNGDYVLGGGPLVFSTMPCTLISTNDDTSNAFYVFGADIIGLHVQPTDLSSTGDDVAIIVESSFDGVYWTNASNIDTITDGASSTPLNLTLHSASGAGVGGFTNGSFNGYTYARVKLDAVTGAAGTDSIIVKVTPFVLFKSR
uniref:Uncharacterized protein n=1 Tax=viral metagenome TaxID=1070528 RepID=A0A6M3K2N7_9ZZZZ